MPVSFGSDVLSAMPDGDDALVARLVERLTDTANAEAAASFPADPIAAGQPGLYSWWCDDAGLTELSLPVDERLPALVYAGQAGASTARSGIERAATLGSRIAGNHLGGNVSSSTFRRTLAAILTDPLDLRLRRAGALDRESNNRLSTWMRGHLSIVIAPHPDRRSLAAAETAVLRTIDPPLNLMGMEVSPIRARLTELRRRLAVEPPDPAIPSADEGPTTPRPIPASNDDGLAGEDLRGRITRAVRPGDVITTLSQGQPNTIVWIGPQGIAVETRRSREQGTGPQLVPYWMIERSWTHLVAHGRVTLTFMLDKDGLNVKRSAFVAALLACFDDVHVVSSRPVELEHRSAQAAALP